MKKIGLTSRLGNLGVVAIILFIGFPVFAILSMPEMEATQLGELRATQPNAYLAKLEKEDPERWLEELKTLSPERYAQEVNRAAAEKSEEEQRLMEVEATRIAAEIERKKSNARKAISDLNWSDAKISVERLPSSMEGFADFKSELEQDALSLVKSLPAEQLEANRNGYHFLASLRPENQSYADKVKSYNDRIEQRRLASVAKLRKKEDRVEGITWYQHPNRPKYLNSRSTVYLYIGAKPGYRPTLRMKVQYAASDWLFVDSVYAWQNGLKELLITGPFDRDNNSTIWEWRDVEPDGYQIEVLRSLGKAKKAILRFEGAQYKRDVELSAGDKRAILDVLEAYDVLSKR